VVEFAARRAKEIGGDAIIVLGAGSHYIGTYSSGSAFTSGTYTGNYNYGNFYGQSYGSTHASAMSVPLFAGKASVLIIKFE
jgi:hypothetical protein